MSRRRPCRYSPKHLARRTLRASSALRDSLAHVRPLKAYAQGGPAVHSSSHPPARRCPLLEPLAPGSGESRSASAARRPPAEGQAASAPNGGPEPLGDVRADLEGVALGPHPSQGGRPCVSPELLRL